VLWYRECSPPFVMDARERIRVGGCSPALCFEVVGPILTTPFVRNSLRTYYYHCLPYKSNSPTIEESQRFSQAQGFYRRLQRLPRFEVREGSLSSVSHPSVVPQSPGAS